MLIKHQPKAATNDADSDSDDDDAQMRQFMEAADHTLLTNAMFQQGATATDPKPAQATAPQATPPSKSERHLDEQGAGAGAGTASDLHITEEMQTHIWGKLSSIIQNQIEFCEQKSTDEKEEPCHDQVRLVSNADCYLSAEIVDTGPPGPKKKPTIKRRTLSEDKSSKAAKTLALATVAISGESIMEAKDTLAWSESKPRQGKLFEYKATDPLGLKLQALHPVNEFTERRLHNKWNEAKIRRKKKK